MQFTVNQRVAVFGSINNRPFFEGWAKILDVGNTLGYYIVAFEDEPDATHERFLGDDQLAQTDPERYVQQLRQSLRNAENVQDGREMLIENSLLEAIYQKSGNRNGFFQLLNRTLLLVTKSIAVVFYEREPALTRGTAETYSFRGHTFLDFKLRPEFEIAMSKHLRQVDPQSSSPSLLSIIQKDMLAFQIFETRFYCVLWEITAAVSAGIKLEVHSIPNDGANEEGRLFARMFGRIPVDKAGFEADVEAALRGMQTYGALKPDDKKLLSKNNAATAKPLLERILPSVMTELERLPEWSMHRVFDQIYNRYKESVLLQQQSKVANLMVFYRLYDRSALRSEGYDYSIRCIIPPSQLRDIEIALEETADVLAAWTYRLPAWDKGTPSQGQAWDEADARVSKLLATADGRREILATVVGVNGDHERVFCEYPLSSGIYNVRRDMFRQGRAVNVEVGATKKSKAAVELSCFRDACLRRVWLLMIPWHKGKPDQAPYSIIQSPIRLGGAPCAAMVSLRRDLNPPDHSIIEGKAFTYTWHFYHSITKHAIRKIRSKVLEAYVEAIASVIGDALANTLNGTQRQPLSEFLGDINQSLTTLARAFPYSAIELQPAIREALRPSTGRSPKQSRPIFLKSSTDNGGAFGFTVNVFDNPFYLRMGSDSFVDAEVIEQQIRSRIMVVLHTRIAGGKRL
jgi:hypothetical protein